MSMYSNNPAALRNLIQDAADSSSKRPRLVDMSDPIATATTTATAAARHGHGIAGARRQHAADCAAPGRCRRGRGAVCAGRRPDVSGDMDADDAAAAAAMEPDASPLGTRRCPCLTATLSSGCRACCAKISASVHSLLFLYLTAMLIECAGTQSTAVANGVAADAAAAATSSAQGTAAAALMTAVQAALASNMAQAGAAPAAALPAVGQGLSRLLSRHSRRSRHHQQQQSSSAIFCLRRRRTCFRRAPQPASQPSNYTHCRQRCNSNICSNSSNSSNSSSSNHNNRSSCYRRRHPCSMRRRPAAVLLCGPG